MVVRSTNEQRRENNRRVEFDEHQLKHAVEVMSQLSIGINNTGIRALNKVPKPGEVFVPEDDRVNWEERHPVSLYEYCERYYTSGSRIVKYFVVTPRREIVEAYYADGNQSGQRAVANPATI